MSKREPPALERHHDAVGVPLPIVHQARFKPTHAIPAESSVCFKGGCAKSDGGCEDDDSSCLHPTSDLPHPTSEWLGPDCDGVIAFDEAHLMKNAAGTKRGRGDWEISFRFAAIVGSGGE